MFLLQATAMVLVPCVVLQENTHHLLDLQVQGRFLVHLLGLLLRLLLVHLVLVLLVIGIEIIGWVGMEWIFHLLLLGMIDQGRHLVLWDVNRIVEAAAAAAGMDVDMEDRENMLFFVLFFVFFLR